MKLDGQRESDNIEDRRGGGGFGGGGFGGGGLGGLGGGGGGGLRGPGVGGLGGVAILLVLLFLGVDPSGLIGGGDPSAGPAQQSQQARPPANAVPQQQAQTGEDPQRRFVAQVLASTEDTWASIFQRMGRTYQPPTLVLYSGRTQSGCGSASSAVGPFYCPNDHKLYLDMSFFRDMQTRLNSPGDFARAYVIAHEVGHHVQNQLGIMRRFEQEGGGGRGREANALSVRLELQADCFAGVWANQANGARQLIEKSDIPQGINAASAVGDDRLQQQGQGYVVPESFTHGSSAQRVRWFETGLRTGDIQQCNTFDAQQL